MSFWTDSSFEPKRKYRFQVWFDNTYCLQAKSISKPKIRLATVEFTQPIGGLKTYDTGQPAWEPITLTLIDLGTGADRSKDWTENTAWSVSNLLKLGANAPHPEIHISQLDAEGNVLEKWHLENPKITRVDYGDLDYSSEDLLEITLEITYDHAKIEFFKAGYAPAFATFDSTFGVN
jgi:hypothetical protein